MRKEKLRVDEKEFLGSLKDTCPKCKGTGKAFCPEKAGESLRNLRIKLSIHGKEIAEELGLSAAEISHRERGIRAMKEPFVVEYIRALKRINARKEKRK